MKTKYLLVLLAIFMAADNLYSDASSDKKKYFAMIYTTGENWDTTKQAHEQAYFKDHSDHLKQLREKEILVLGGRFSDKGFLIIKCADEDEAIKIVNDDISVLNRTFQAEVFPFLLFYEGSLQK